MDKRERILQATQNGFSYLLHYARAAGYDFPERQKPNEWRSGGNGKIRIRKNKYGVWNLTDFSNGLPSGDIFAVAASEYGLSSAKSDFPNILDKLCEELNLSGETFTTWKPSKAARPKPKAAPYKPNAAYKPRISYTYSLAEDTDTRNQVFGRWGISPAILDKYGVREISEITYKGGYTRKATEKEPLFLFQAGGNKKVYSTAKIFGKPGEKSKTRFLESSGNQVYGYEQLPESCEGIVIAAGQKDMLAINSLLNESGIYAICLGSEGASLPAELFRDLHKRTKGGKYGLFVLYDNDKTGWKQSKKITRKYPAIRILNVPERAINDVCDFIEAKGKKGAKAMKKAILRQISALNDPYHIGAKYTTFALKKSHIGKDRELCGKLFSFIQDRRFVQVRANTGLGKTTWIVRELSKRIQSKIIMLFPTQAICQQQASEYGFPSILAGSKEEDFARVKHEQVIFATYDSVWRVYNILGEKFSDCWLIFDESHHLVNDCSRGFKFDENNRAYELREYAEKTILLSGTPSEFMKYEGFDFVRIQEKSPKPLRFIPVEYEGKLRQAIGGQLLKAKKGEIHLVLWDSKKELRALKRMLVRSGNTLESEIAILCSDDKKKNETYQAIKDKGVIPKGIRFVFTTRLLADGVNIQNKNIGLIIEADVKNEELAIQFPARCRALKTLTVYYYRNESEPKGFFEPIADSIARKARIRADRLEDVRATKGAGQSYTKGHLSQDDYAGIYRSKITGEWEASSLYDYQVLAIDRDYRTHTALFLERIARKYEYVEIRTGQQSKPLQDDTLEAAIKADKREERKAKEQLRRDLCTRPEIVLETFNRYTEGKKDALATIQAELPQPEKSKVEEYISSRSELKEFSIWEPVKGFLKLCETGLSPEAAGKAVAEIKDRGSLGKLKNSILLQTWIFLHEFGPEGKRHIDDIEIVRVNHYRELLSIFGAYQGKQMSAKEVQSLYNDFAESNRSFEPCRTSHRAVQRLAEQFHIERKKVRRTFVRELTADEINSKKIEKRELTADEIQAGKIEINESVWVYEIGDPLTLQSLLYRFNMDLGEFLNRLGISLVPKLNHIRKES